MTLSLLQKQQQDKAVVSFCTSMEAVQGSLTFRWMWPGDEWQALVSNRLEPELCMGEQLNTALSSCLTRLLAANSRRSHAWPTIFLFSPVCPTAPGAAAVKGGN